MYDIVIADDHPLFRRALTEALAETRFEHRVTECETFNQTYECLRANRPDLLLLDLKMPGESGLFGLMHIRAEFPEVAVAVVSASEDSQIIHSVRQAGTLGFIPKSSRIEELVTALETVLQGNLSYPSYTDYANNAVANKLASLTPQQLRVLQLIADGALNKQIGYTLNIKETTVKSHISDIFRKLDIYNRTQAALLVQQLEIPD
ncbi:response regulator transcription factor [Sessilibacter sp. MAH2]